MTNHIIITSTIPRIRYESNGMLDTYDFPFPIFKTSDLKVYFGSEQQEATTYTVSGAGESEGGTVTLSNIPESGVIITLTRELPIERTSDFQEGGALRAKVLNDELDYQIACQQQIADNLNRSMVLPPYAADGDVNLTLPIPSAGKAIVWNSEGTNLENSTVEVNVLESTLRGYKESAENACITATAKADVATTQAQTATTQAGIATAKAAEAVATLSAKVNKDMDNLSTTGKENIINLNMPDWSAGIDITPPKVATPYTCPSDGVYCFCIQPTSTSFTLYINGIKTANMTHNSSTGNSNKGSTSVFLQKNDSIYFEGNIDNTFSSTFYPLKGVQND